MNERRKEKVRWMSLKRNKENQNEWMKEEKERQSKINEFKKKNEWKKKWRKE